MDRREGGQGSSLGELRWARKGGHREEKEKQRRGGGMKPKGGDRDPERKGHGSKGEDKGLRKKESGTQLERGAKTPESEGY